MLRLTLIPTVLTLSFLSAAPLARAQEPATVPATEATTAPEGETSQEGVEVKTATLELSAEASGSFVPEGGLELKPVPKAYASELKIKAIAAQGAAVKKGGVLLELDRTEYDSALAGADRDVALAQATLERTRVAHAIAVSADKIAYDAQSRATAAAVAEVEWWDKVDGPMTLQQFEQQIKQVADRVEDASDELDQLKKMYKSEELTNATSDIVVKRAVRELEQMKLALEMTKQRVDKQKQTEFKEARLRLVDAAEGAKQALEMLKAEQATHAPQRASEVAAAEEAVTAAVKKTTELNADAGLFKVLAPFDGVAYLGELAGGAWARTEAAAVAKDEKITAGQIVLTFVDPAKLRLEVSLTEEQAARVTPGLPVWVTPGALPELACGGKTTSTTIVPGGAGGTYVMFIALDRASDRLRPGMKASVAIDLPDAENVLTVPSAAVKNGRVKVMKENGKTETRDVVLGRTDGTLSEVVSGLNAGEHVAGEQVTGE